MNPKENQQAPSASIDISRERSREYLKELKPYFRSVRGTGLYWANVRSDLMSMLGNPALESPWPTFFVTLSAADTIWPDFFRVCDPSLTLAEAAKLTPAKRRKYLNENPDLAAHHFHRRFLSFFNHILRGGSKPLGEIVDWFWRIEFQRRGSPHVHALFWMKDTPNILELSKTDEGIEKLRNFADRFISCLLRYREKTMNSESANEDPLTVRPPPSANVEDRERDLSAVVERVQQHVCSGRSSCQRDGRCRFGFPKPLQETTNVIRDEKDGKISIQFVHARDNDATNNYNAAMLSVWRANMDIKIVGNAYGAAEYTAAYVSKAEPDSVRFHKTIQRAVSKLPAGAPHASILKRTANALLGAREVSAQEAIYILSNTLNLYGKSRTVTKVKVTRHSRRFYRFHEHEAPRRSNGESIRVEEIERAYMERPESAHFEQLTFRRFCEAYDISDEIPSKSQRLERWALRDGSGFIKARSQKQVIRPSPYLRADEANPDFCLAQMFLDRPWRTLEQLPESDSGTIEMYQEWKDNGQAEWATRIDERINRENALASTPQNAIHLPSPQWVIAASEGMAPANGPTSTPTTFKPRFEYSTQDIRRAKAFVKNEIKQFLLLDDLENTHQPPRPYIYPTPDQRPAMSTDQWRPFAAWMMQSRRRAHSLRHKQECRQLQMIVTGEGGTGKTWLIQQILKDMQVTHQDLPRARRVLLMAHQGSAAHLIGGRTISSALSLPPRSVSFRTPYSSLADTPGGPATLRRLQQEYEDVHFIVIDEFGVISCGMIYWISRRLCEIFAQPESVPFGGRDILFTGDPGQLGPVKSTPLSTALEHVATGGTELAGRLLWIQIPHFYLLQQQNRGQEDPEWYTMLGRVRTGDATEEDVALINTRVCLPTGSTDSDEIHIAYRNCDVDAANESALHALNKPVLQIDAHHDIRVRSVADADGLDESKIQELHEHARALTSQAAEHLPMVLRLAIGAPVVLTFNLEQRAGLCNGSRGTVYDVMFDSESGDHQPIVLVQMKTYRGPSFVEGVTGVVPITSRTVGLTVDKQCKFRFSRIALPLKLGFATTIHKIQGQTCSKIVFNPCSMSSSALAYVALSRVRRRGDIFLTSPVTRQSMQRKDKDRSSDEKEEKRLEPIQKKSEKTAVELVKAMQLVASNYNSEARRRDI